MKKKSIANLIQTKKKFDLCDIWRIRDPKKKNVLLSNNNISQGLFKEDLITFFLSNLLQESVNKTDILEAFSTDQYKNLTTL